VTLKTLKMEMQRERLDPEDSCVLVVVVDDYIPFHSSSDEAALDEAVRATLPSLRLDFMRIVMLGASGRLFFQFVG